MKINLTVMLVCISAWFYGTSMLFGDILFFSTGHTLSGMILQTNGDDILVLTKCAAFNFSKTSIKEFKMEPPEASESSSTNRLPDFEQAIFLLSKQLWATNLTPIPATVIDKGILRNVPYTSFHCGSDYEVNIYGDLENPSGMEIGVYRKLLDDSSAKDNCVKFISNLLNQPADKEIVLGLDLKKDLKTRDELTFEITPPTDEDAYNGWWVSVYSEKQLNLARASDGEMKLISITQADSEKSKDLSSWSADELKQARSTFKTTITFTNTSGVLISDAEVVRVIDGVNLIWQKGLTNSGMIKLADLPEDLRIRFGYDAAKTKAADELAKEDQARWHQEAQVASAAQAQANQAAAAQNDSSSYFYPGYSGSYSDGGYSGGGSVYVHGYMRSNGTYVNGYTRSAPSR